MKKILIFGSGSVGTYLGTKLYAIGHQVFLYDKPNILSSKLDRLNEKIFINDKLYQLPPRCYQIEDNIYDIIFITTKLYDVKNALSELKKYQLNPQFIVFIQNGIVEPDFYEGFQKHPGFTTVSLFNGYHFTDNQILVKESNLGWQLENSLVAHKIYKLLFEAGIHCHISPNIFQIRLQKLIVNAALNTLSAIEKKTIKELIIDPNLKRIIDGIIQESWTVLKEYYDLPSLESLQNNIYRLIFQVQEHYSSMYQDVISGRKTEVEFLNGLIIRLGHQKQIPTPFNEQVYSRLLDLTKSCA